MIGRRCLGVLLCLAAPTWITPSPAAASGPTILGVTATVSTSPMWTGVCTSVPCPTPGSWSFRSLMIVGTHNGQTSGVTITGGGSFIGDCRFALGSGTLSIDGEAADPVQIAFTSASGETLGGGGAHPISFGHFTVRPVTGDCLTSPAIEWLFTGLIVVS